MSMMRSARQCLQRSVAALESALHASTLRPVSAAGLETTPSSSLHSMSSVQSPLPHTRAWSDLGGTRNGARHVSTTPAPGAKTIAVTYHDEKDDSTKTCQVPIGENLMEAAHSNDIDLEGACEGSLACSTCHIVIESQEMFEKLPEADDDENDMLDLAVGLTETSRLGCQVIATEDLDGISVRIPSATRNFAVDGHVPKPH